MSGIEIVKPTLQFIASNGDTEKVSQLQQQINSSIDDDYLRLVEAEIKRAQSTAKNADNVAQLDLLLKTSELRRSCIIKAREARDAATKTDVFDKAFSDRLNANIQFVGETTDQKTLDQLLSSVSTSRDLQSLQNAVKKLDQVKNTVSLQPSDASFAKKGLSARDWNVKLQQIGTALQTRMNEMSKEKIAARSAPLVVANCDTPSPSGLPSGKSIYDIFMQFLWLWIVLFVLLIVAIIVAIVIYKRNNSGTPVTPYVRTNV